MSDNGTRQRSGLVWVALAALPVLALIGMLYSRDRADMLEEPAAAQASETGTIAFLMEQQWLIRMKLAEAELRDLAPQVRAVGRIIPAANHRAVVSSPVAGLIGEEGVPLLGQEVRRGGELLTLRQIQSVAEAAQVVQLRLEVGRTASERRELEQGRIEAEIRLEHARRELDRAKRLHEAELIAQQEFEAAETDFQAAETVVSSFAMQLETLMEAPTPEVAAASTTPRHVLTSPIGGKVAEVYKSVGELVQAGEPILEVVNFETVWVEAPIFEKDLPAVLDAGRATFETAAYPGVEFEGRVVDVGVRIDEETRTATVTFEVPNPDGRLRIGMQANVRLDAGSPRSVIIIPAEAVLEHEGQDIVYVLLSGEEFERREVVLEGRYGNEVVVLGGLQPGERVVTQGAYQLKLQELQPADPGEHTHEV